MRRAFATLAAAIVLSIPTLACAIDPESTTDKKPDVGELIDRISNKDKTVCIHAIDELGKLGVDAKPAVSALMEALANEDHEICTHVCLTLAAVGGDAEAAVPKLIETLDHENVTLRAYAAYALGRVGKPAEPAVDKLIALAFVEDSEGKDYSLVRRAAIRAVCAIDPPQEKTLPLVVRLLQQSNPAIVTQILHEFAEEGEAGVPRLRNALRHEEACYWACIVAAELGPKAKDAIGDLIEHGVMHKEADVQMQAILALGAIGPDAKSAVPVLVRELQQDEFPTVRVAAAYALGQIGEKAGAEDALEAAMKSDHNFLRMTAAWALAKLDPQNEERVDRAVDLIVAGFDSEESDVRSAAAQALSHLNGKPGVVIPKLVKALGDSNPDVAANALNALVGIGPETLKGIQDGLTDKIRRPYAIQLVYRLGPKGQPAVPHLIDALGNEPRNEDDLFFRREVQFALAAIGPGAKDAVPALTKSLDSEDAEIRGSAAYALGKIGSAAQDAVGKLREIAADENAAARLGCVWALLQIHPNDDDIGNLAVPLLISALGDERELVRYEAATALGQLSRLPLARETAVAPLEALLVDRHPAVRNAAIEALKKLRP